MKIPGYTSLEEKGYSLNVKEPAKIFERYQCIVDADEFDCWYKENNIPGRFFRGVKEAKYKNFTSAQRLYFTQDYHNSGPQELVVKQVEELRRAYKGILASYCKSLNIPCTDLFLMSCAQHHSDGISPLLDFSSNIKTALYFMCSTTHTTSSGAGDYNKEDINNYVSMYSFPSGQYINAKTIANIIVKEFKKLVYSKIPKHPKLSKSELIKKTHKQSELAQFIDNQLNNFFSCEGLFKLYQDSGAIFIENKPFPIKVEDFKTEAKITISNLNIVAQQGCFIYHNKGITPLERGLSCVDIHKSLIPYIIKKYLEPRNICEETLFPTEDKIVSESTFNMMANIVAPQKK